tara:strand:- start:2894 stop:3391 length:498 start_codon:yes stop_codon:yes gene_type:complete
MEIIKTNCNLNNIKVNSGTYDIQKVTGKQEIPHNTWIDIIGSSITYKPQNNSNKLNYFYNTYIIGDAASIIQCSFRVIVRGSVFNSKTIILKPMEQHSITAYYQFTKKEFPSLWDQPHKFKSQIFIDKPNNAFLNYTTTIINRKFAATFTPPFLSLENIYNEKCD